MSSTPLLEGHQSVLLGLSEKELQAFAVELGQPAFRGRQIYDWLYNKGVRELSAISVLPKAWREHLDQIGVTIGRLQEIKRLVASDETIKLLLATDEDREGEAIAAHLMKLLKYSAF